jgi:hypothetical protein
MRIDGGIVTSMGRGEESLQVINEGEALDFQID